MLAYVSYCWHFSVVIYDCISFLHICVVVFCFGHCFVHVYFILIVNSNTNHSKGAAPSAKHDEKSSSSESSSSESSSSSSSPDDDDEEQHEVHHDDFLFDSKVHAWNAQRRQAT
jgi:hypothetical protein